MMPWVACSGITIIGVHPANAAASKTNGAEPRTNSNIRRPCRQCHFTVASLICDSDIFSMM